MKKIRDRIILGLISGAVGNIFKDSFSEIAFRKGFEKRRFSNMIAGVFLPKKNALNKKGSFFGFYNDFSIASFLGIPLVYLLSFTGKDNWMVKGMLTGGLGFGLLRGLMANVGPGKTYPKDAISNLSMTIGSMFWGIAAAGTAVLFGNKILFNPGPLNKQNELKHDNTRINYIPVGMKSEAVRAKTEPIKFRRNFL